jgi:hypothetical protein
MNGTLMKSFLHLKRTLFQRQVWLFVLLSRQTNKSQVHVKVDKGPQVYEVDEHPGVEALSIED